MIKAIDNLAKKVQHGIGISLNEGFEWLRRRRKHLKETRRLQDEEKVFRTESQETLPEKGGQQRYLQHALSYIKKEEPLYWHLLMLRMEVGRKKEATKWIAKQLSKSLQANITVDQVERKESEAIACMKATIKRLRRTGIPLVGDPFAEKSVIVPA